MGSTWLTHDDVSFVRHTTFILKELVWEKPCPPPKKKHIDNLGFEAPKSKVKEWRQDGSWHQTLVLFLQAGLLQSNITVTISALPKWTRHWHRCTENVYMEWQVFQVDAHSGAKCSNKTGGWGWRVGGWGSAAQKQTNWRQTNRHQKLGGYMVTFFK